MVQLDAGPPISGTYRHAFKDDTTPRKVPVSNRKWVSYSTLFYGPSQTNYEEALQVLAVLEQGVLHGTELQLPQAVWQGLAHTVVVGGFRELIERHPGELEYVDPHHFRVKAPLVPGRSSGAGAAAAAPEAEGAAAAE